ncbi:hypothetical protein TP2_01910 [Thioclava pacifica DSM 10166]|uniref:Uncharacterized protein n=1 Tax=Thioclava pacifica DSM 10166 TaxID=1353537 RepID=A0A074JK95_9RHOB|nr:hypothetical protein TP2_01910 [Thioclava pacifica DSM 10166]
MVSFDTLALAVIAIALIREAYLRLRPASNAPVAERG